MLIKQTKQQHHQYILLILKLFKMIKNTLMVPRVGLEPTLPRETDFESVASTNSATPAHQFGNYESSNYRIARV